MDLTLRIVDAGYLQCEISHGESRASFVAWDCDQGLAGLVQALDDLTVNGIGECFWQQPAGCFRWLFRQEADRLRIAVISSTGVVTGWEHVFWAEGPCAEWCEQIRHAAAKVSAPERER
jgi:hypothetical protein